MSNCFYENTCSLPVNTVLPANETPAMATITGNLSSQANAALIPPKDLTGLDRWVAHRNKVPVDCHSGSNGDVTKPGTWVSYMTAVGFTTLHPDTGLGFVISGDDDIVGIDIDHCLVDGKVTDSRILQISDRIKTYAEVSPSGTGLHIYVRGQWPEGARNKVKLEDGIAIEVYDRNRYFTVTGNQYGEAAIVAADQPLLDYIYEEYFKQVSTGSQIKIEPLQIKIVETPAEILERIESQVANSDKFEGLWSGTDRSGDESSDDMRLLCQLVSICDYDPDVIAAAFLESPFAKTKDDAHLQKLDRPDYLARSIVRAIEYVADNSGAVKTDSDSDLLNYDFNDYGNARRLLSLYQGRVLYDSVSGNWLLYDNGCWKPDNKRNEGMYKIANELYCNLESILYKEYADDVREAELLDDEDEEDDDEADFYREQREKFIKLHKEVRKLGNHATQRNMLKNAATQSIGAGIEFNSHNHLLVVQNGTIDLRNGSLLPHIPGYHITMRADIKYNPAAPEPKRFLQFLNEIFEHNQELINYVQRLFGYCLTGETREHVFHVLHGEGANGKSVLINLISRILGEYCKDISAGALQKRNDEDKPNPSLLQAKDARIIIVNETNAGVKLNSALIKQISAGDEICPRALFKDNEHFTPHMQLLWITNHIPEIDWNDGGIRRRYRLIPFGVTFTPEQQDRNLPEKLWAEREGILRWLVEGAIEWYAHGLGDLPDTMAEALEKERRAEDSLYAFYQDKIINTGDSKDQIPASNMYKAYQQYCLDNELDYPVTVSAMGTKLPKLGAMKKKTSSCNVYIGVKLRNKAE